MNNKNQMIAILCGDDPWCNAQETNCANCTGAQWLDLGAAAAQTANIEDVAAVEPESEPTSTVAVPTDLPAPEPVVCTDHTLQLRNCISTGCCIDSSLTCFKRDDNYAECLSSCTHLAHAWSCVVHTAIADPAGPPAEEPEDPEVEPEDPEVETEDPEVETEDPEVETEDPEVETEDLEV